MQLLHACLLERRCSAHAIHEPHLLPGPLGSGGRSGPSPSYLRAAKNTTM